MPKYFKKRNKKKKKKKNVPILGQKQNFPQNSVLISFFPFWRSISLCQILNKKNLWADSNTGFRQTDARKISSRPLTQQFLRYVLATHQTRTTINNIFHGFQQVMLLLIAWLILIVLIYIGASNHEITAHHKICNIAEFALSIKKSRFLKKDLLKYKCHHHKLLVYLSFQFHQTQDNLIILLSSYSIARIKSALKCCLFVMSW